MPKQTSVHGWAYYNKVDPCRCGVCKAFHRERVAAQRARRKSPAAVSA
jgi:hypothetical protein